MTTNSQNLACFIFGSTCIYKNTKQEFFSCTNLQQNISFSEKIPIFRTNYLLILKFIVFAESIADKKKALKNNSIKIDLEQILSLLDFAMLKKLLKCSTLYEMCFCIVLVVMTSVYIKKQSDQ